MNWANQLLAFTLYSKTDAFWKIFVFVSWLRIRVDNEYSSQYSSTAAMKSAVLSHLFLLGERERQRGGGEEKYLNKFQMLWKKELLFLL